MPSPTVALFAATILGSAFLIFFVQPMVGKHILPWFGGAPAVWLVCVAFYQVALFFGYTYAHWLNARLRPSAQLWVHAGLFAAALWVLPVLPDESWKPEGGAPPSRHILAMLAVNVGPPFLLLAATGPLLQAWFARVFPGRSPYGLYAISNVGSLAALLSYPFAVEPNFALSLQAGTWSWVFAACGLAVLACGWQMREADGGSSAPAAPQNADAARAIEVPSVETTARVRLLWVLLPACAVVLFMGVTNELCLDVASIPFLWVVPLAIYLLTFIVCFGSEKLYRRGLFATLTLLSAALLVWARSGAFHALTLGSGASPIAMLAALYLLALFFSCMLVHGELYRLRPRPEGLTVYYSCVSGGGALGGLFVALLAPRLFSEYYELSLGWLACVLLATLAWLINPGSLLRKPGVRRAFAGTVSLAVVGASVLGVRAIDSLYDAARAGDTDSRLLYQTRNFFSIMRVLEVLPDNPDLHHVMLKHGTTSHGAQFHRPDLRRMPVSYFGVYTGIGMVMHERPKTPMHVGIMGLGAGALAAYGREGDRFQFYEIDPDVIRVTRDDGYFSYLADSLADTEVVAGDARLTLERQLRDSGSQHFDLLIMDAFSSDSVPVHLITLDAMQLYLRHLKPDGVLVVHISNVNLDLSGLVFRLASELGMHARKISNAPFPRRVQSSADWMVLCRNAGYFEPFPAVAEQIRAILKAKPRALQVKGAEAFDLAAAPLWTDDYSDLFSVLRRPNWARLWPADEAAASPRAAAPR